MEKFYIRASYTQWITTEIMAENQEHAYEIADSLDLENDYKQGDISDFYIHECKK